jgi:hypothetical protein
MAEEQPRAQHDTSPQNSSLKEGDEEGEFNDSSEEEEEDYEYDEPVCMELLARSRHKLGEEGQLQPNQDWVDFVKQLDPQWLEQRGLHLLYVGMLSAITDEYEPLPHLSQADILAAVSELPEEPRACYMVHYDYVYNSR